MCTIELTSLDALDAASGYATSGVVEFFAELRTVPLADWPRWLDALTTPAPLALEEATAGAVPRVHPWALWRARDQLASELWRLDSCGGRAAVRSAKCRAAIARRVEQVALALLTRPWGGATPPHDHIRGCRRSG